MTQPNSAHLQQQHSLQASNMANSTESLMSNAFDLIGGASAAQQFLSHMDLYRQQQQREHQQQLNYQHRQQQQQELLSSLSPQQSIASSSNSSSPSSTQAPSFLQQQRQHTPPTLNQHNHNFSHSLNHSHSHNHLNHFNSHHLNHTLKQQQHQPQPINNNQQQHYNTKHSISLTTSPIPSPTALIPTTTSSSAAAAAAAFASLTTTTSATLLNLKNSQQQSFNLHNNNHQMDVQLQQQSQLQNAAQATNNNGGGPSAAIATSAGSPTSTASVTLATANSATHQQQHHQHTHAHQHAGNSSPYKSCWCFGESVCSGIEVEIENNNNNNHFHHGDSTYHMKILVPAVASGAIIGKGGETIAALQKDSGARVKMSKSHDFYPGTTERVCLITGSVDGIMTVLDFIMDKIREKPDLTTKIIDAEAKQTQERDKQVKILVPNSTAGMIIGKGGAYIKQIKEESGSYVQISQKPKDISLQERCITIIGDKENNKNACKMILSKIVEDPQSGTCLNVSYADVNGPVANFNPTGSPYATNQNAINSSTASLNSTLGQTIGGAATAAGLLVNGTGINLSLNLGSPNPAPNLAVATQLLEHIKVAMRGSGYSETATTEVCAALGVLAKYGVLGMGVGVPHANGAHTSLGSYLGVSALDQQTANAATGNVFGAVGQVNLEQYAAAAAAAAAANRPTQSQLEAAAAAAQFDPFRHLSSAAQAATPVSLNNNSFGLTAATGTAGNSQQLGASAAHSLSGLSKSPTPGDLGAKDSKNVEIPEVIVGAILGPNGRSLVEIQHVSGANVQISKKGIFAPGTRNRIVTITGQPSAIAKAQFLIEQKINEEETKRARQIPLTTTVVN